MCVRWCVQELGAPIYGAGMKQTSGYHLNAMLNEPRSQCPDDDLSTCALWATRQSQHMQNSIAGSTPRTSTKHSVTPGVAPAAARIADRMRWLSASFQSCMMLRRTHTSPLSGRGRVSVPRNRAMLTVYDCTHRVITRVLHTSTQHKPVELTKAHTIPRTRRASAPGCNSAIHSL